MITTTSSTPTNGSASPWPGSNEIQPEQLGAVEDRLFSTVFMGSGLLFLAMLLAGTVTSASLMVMLAEANVNVDVFAYGRDTSQG